MKKAVFVAICFLLLSSAVFAQNHKDGSFQGTARFSGGVGIGATGIVPPTMGWTLTLFNLRAGGYTRILFADLGTSSLGLEAGTWIFCLPVGTGITFLEIPISLAWQFSPSSNQLLVPSLGYCLILGMGESTQISHSISAGLRWESKNFFCEGALYAPLARDNQWYPFPHLAAGWKF